MSELIFGFRFILALVFVLAGLAKLSSSSEFLQAVSNYELLPERWVSPVAKWLPWLELTAGLLLGVGILTTVAFALAAMLLSFSLAVSVNLARGRRIDCGCFGSAAPRRISWGTVGRNLALALLAFLVAVGSPHGFGLWEPLQVSGRTHISDTEGLALLVSATTAALAIEIASLGFRAARSRRLIASLAGGLP